VGAAMPVEGAMKARKILHESAYGPETIKFMSETLEVAWARIAPTFGEDREAKEAARQTLARIILSLPIADHPPTVEKLADLALETMAQRS
jgi:hypothetical protein